MGNRLRVGLTAGILGLAGLLGWNLLSSNDKPNSIKQDEVLQEERMVDAHPTENSNPIKPKPYREAEIVESNGELVLMPYHLNGIVKDAEGHPLKGVKVHSADSHYVGGKSLETIVFSGEKGEVILAVPDNLPKRVIGELDDNVADVSNVRPGEYFELVFTPHYKVSIEVVNSKGEVVSDAEVSLSQINPYKHEGYPLKKNSNGIFESKNRKKGVYEAVAKLGTLSAKTEFGLYNKDKTVQVKIPDGILFNGVVTNEDDAPIPEATIEIADEDSSLSISLQTSIDGKFGAPVSPSVKHIEIKARDYASKTINRFKPSGKNEHFTLEGGNDASGLIFGPDNLPLPNAELSLSDAEGWAHTDFARFLTRSDLEGFYVFKISRLEPLSKDGEFGIYISHKDYGNQFFPKVALHDGKFDTISVNPGYRLIGRLEGDASNLEKILVTLNQTDVNSFSEAAKCSKKSVAVKGRTFELEKVGKGKYEIVATSLNGGGSAQVEVDRDKSVVIPFSIWKDIVVEARDSADAPMPGTNVELLGNRNYFAICDKNGQGILPHVIRGDYNGAAYHADTQNEKNFSLKFDGTNSKLEITFDKQKQVNLRVYDSTNHNPINYVRLSYETPVDNVDEKNKPIKGIRIIAREIQTDEDGSINLPLSFEANNLTIWATGYNKLPVDLGNLKDNKEVYLEKIR